MGHVLPHRRQQGTYARGTHFPKSSIAPCWPHTLSEREELSVVRLYRSRTCLSSTPERLRFSLATSRTPLLSTTGWCGNASFSDHLNQKTHAFAKTGSFADHLNFDQTTSICQDRLWSRVRRRQVEGQRVLFSAGEYDLLSNDYRLGLGSDRLRPRCGNADAFLRHFILP